MILSLFKKDINAYHRKKHKEYYNANPQKYINRRRISVQRIRSIILDRLGNKCIQCGFDDIRAIQIDHVNGGGTREITKLGNTERYYKHIITQLDLGLHTYQLLCANCNQIKKHTNNECIRK